jgi:hypothetical protein
MTLKPSVVSLAACLAFLGAAAQVAAQDTTSATATGSYSGALRGSGMRGVTDQTKFSGSIDIMPSGKPGIFKVEIRLSSSGYSSSASVTGQLQWSISPGRCNSRVQFLLPPAEMPALEMRSGGNAEVKWEGAITMAPFGTYQMMVFDRGLREQDIVACANLKYSAPKK